MHYVFARVPNERCHQVIYSCCHGRRWKTKGRQTPCHRLGRDKQNHCHYSCSYTCHVCACTLHDTSSVVSDSRDHVTLHSVCMRLCAIRHSLSIYSCMYCIFIYLHHYFYSLPCNQFTDESVEVFCDIITHKSLSYLKLVYFVSVIFGTTIPTSFNINLYHLGLVSVEVALSFVVIMYYMYMGCIRQYGEFCKGSTPTQVHKSPYCLISHVIKCSLC